MLLEFNVKLLEDTLEESTLNLGALLNVYTTIHAEVGYDLRLSVTFFLFLFFPKSVHAVMGMTSF